MSKATPVKVYFLTQEAQEGVIRRFSIPVDTTDFVYEFITDKVKELFKTEIEENASIYLKWKDDEGDLIDFSTEEEAREALRTVGDGTLNIYAGELLGKRTTYLACAECKEPVKGARYVCLVCPNYNMCDTCETAGHHLEHDMVKLVKNDISEVMEFPQDKRGEFVPPPRFRRWMNRFTRRWHRRNGCLVVNGDRRDQEASELSSARMRRWGSAWRHVCDQDWDSQDRSSMRRAWRRHWRNEDASGDDSEPFGRKRGRGRAGCHMRANRRFWRRHCQGSDGEFSNEEMGENRRQLRRRRCGRQNNEKETCDEQSPCRDDSGSRGRRRQRRCSRRNARTLDTEEKVIDTSGDKSIPSHNEDIGEEFVQVTEEDALIEEDSTITEQKKMKCKERRHGRRCHRKTEKEEIDEEGVGEKESQFQKGRRCRKRYESHTDNEENEDRERSLSVKGRRCRRRRFRRYEQKGYESTEGERSPSHDNKRCGRRHARFSDDEEAKYGGYEEKSWPRMGRWRQGCGRGRFRPCRDGRQIHPGIRTWRRFETELEAENNDSNIAQKGERRMGCSGEQWVSRRQGRQIHPGMRTWRRFAKMMTEFDTENYDSDTAQKAGWRKGCDKGRWDMLRRQGRQTHPGIRSWRRFARMMTADEAANNDSDMVQKEGWRKGCDRRRWGSRRHLRQIHPGIRTWRRFSKLMTENDDENYDSEIERSYGSERALRMMSKRLGNIPYYGIKKGCNWRCRIPVRRRFRN